MDALLSLLLALLAPDDFGEGLRRTAPTYLTADQARLHLASATIAGAAFKQDPALLLAIAFYESRYTAGTLTPEPRQKVSCGVMTPIPKAVCRPPGVLLGYLEGADHLRGWVRNQGLNGGLLGYAGGYSLLRKCADGAHLVVRKGLEIDLCSKAVTARLGRAQMISRSLRARASS